MSRSAGAFELADCNDSVAANADVRGIPGSASAVKNLPVLDNDIKSRGLRRFLRNGGKAAQDEARRQNF